MAYPPSACQSEFREGFQAPPLCCRNGSTTVHYPLVPKTACLSSISGKEKISQQKRNSGFLFAKNGCLSACPGGYEHLHPWGRKEAGNVGKMRERCGKVLCYDRKHNQWKIVCNTNRLLGAFCRAKIYEEQS